MDDIIVYVITSSLLQRIGKRIEHHFTKYRGTYGFGVLAICVLASMLYYSFNSGPKLCIINKFQPGRPVLSNVSLYPEGAFSDVPRSLRGTVSKHNIHITSGDYGTRIEVRKWGRNGFTGGSYAELTGEVFCSDTNICPPVLSSGDYIGIATMKVRSSEVMVMYTIFLLPTLEERARGWIFFDSSTDYLRLRSFEILWVEVIDHFCGYYSNLLILAMVCFGYIIQGARELGAHTSLSPLPVLQHRRRAQGVLPGPLNDQDQQELGPAPSTSESDGPNAAGDSDSPPIQHSTDADTSRLTDVPDDLRSSSDSLVSTKSEKGGSGNSRMVGPRHSGLPHAKQLGATSSSSSSGDEQVSSDSSSEDDSIPPSNVQEESTPDVPPPHYVRHRMHTVYETVAGDTTVPRPTPEGSECSI